MRKKALLAILLPFLISVIIQQPVLGQTDYEKFGRIAIAVVKENYPGVEVKEYQYLGRQKINENQAVDSFKFNVTEDAEKKSVIVLVKHSIKEGKVLDVTVQEEKVPS